MQKLRIDIWSDLACPWCYIGKRHLEQALATFEHAADVEIVWRAFELDPGAPKLREPVPNAERIAQKYRISLDQAHTMMERVIEAGKLAGLDMKLHDSKAGNTFDAHRLLHWAGTLGQQGAMKERLMRAYQCDGAVISNPDVLVELAAEVGLDAAQARAVLGSDRYATEVRGDEQLAQELGITGVPFFVLAGKLAVSGAQPVETMKLVLAKAWAERPQIETIADGAACGPDGCAIADAE